ncbi:hypothetical protein AVEN_55332-1 [Araneus ventricosus]|uniref:MADF domain-containing protein n=1 Tax=Araneus ventricosus TaxID=182803 RepID=A0A4Y2DE34_ARAVE|nr:hypothetical protein AVEN_55332-1 [Araneus ventricosus]
MEGSHENSVSFQATSAAMMYFAALLVFGSIVEFSTVGAREVRCSPIPCKREDGCQYFEGFPCGKCVCPNEKYCLDSELMILEFEKYPYLYDSRHNDFKNRELKKDAWMAVTKNVIGEK